MRSRLAVLPAALLIAACGEAVDGTPTPAGALLDLRADTYLGFDATGGGGDVVGVRVDDAGSPVVVSTAEFAGQPALTRGTDLASASPLSEFSGSGFASGFALAPDDTAVVLGSAGLDSSLSGAVVVRVGPDGTQQGIQLQAPESLALAPPEAVAYSADATRLAAATVARDTSQGFPVLTGALDVLLADTTTGATVGTASLPLFEPVSDIPGETPPLTVRWVVATADGGVAVSTEDDAGAGQVIWLDAALAEVGTTTDVPDGFAAPTADGDVVLATPGEAGALHRLRAGAALETVADLPDDWFRTTGLAVDEAEGRAYLTGAVGTGGDGFPENVLSVDLATGSLAGPVALCDQGTLGRPDVRGDALLVSGTCNDDGLLQEHVYLLGPAA